MADQDRWSSDRNRGRWVEEDRSRRGYDDYGPGAQYGRGGEDRTFRGRDLDDDVYGAGYGADDYGRTQRYPSQAGSRRGGGASWAQSSYGQGPREGYSQSAHARGAQGGYGGYGDQGAYGQGAGGYGAAQGRDYGSSQYRGASYDPRRRDETSYGSGSSRYGGALGYGGADSSEPPRYADPDWSPTHRDASGEHRGWLERTGDKIAHFFGAETHRGRGPKNYTRSDDHIRDDVNDRLTDDPFLDASDIDVAVSSMEVTLTGKVNTRDEKRRAEDVAEQVSGVSHVQNNLRVQSPSYGDAAYGSAGFGATPASGATAQTGTGAMTSTAADGLAAKIGATRSN